MEKEFNYSIVIEAAPQEVWNALTTPEMTRKFMYNCEPITDWNEGSELKWRGAEDGIDYVIGHVVKFDPEIQLAFTVFNPHESYENVPDNYLTSEYNLTPCEKGTLIKIRQWDYSLVEDGEKRYKDAQAGWDFAMQELKKILEN